MVNGVPASGKSAVARGLSQATGWPVYALDTVKNPFLAEIESVDRSFNRVLGRASYRAIFALIAAAPAGTTVDRRRLVRLPAARAARGADAGSAVDAIPEIWCACAARGRSPPATATAPAIGRPAIPAPTTSPELIELAGRAEPVRVGPVIDVDTTVPIDAGAAAEVGQ